MLRDFSHVTCQESKGRHRSRHGWTKMPLQNVKVVVLYAFQSKYEVADIEDAVKVVH